MDTTASPPGSLSSSPESRLGQEKSRQRFADPSNSNESHSSSGGRVYSPDNLPFNLSHIKKTPRIVLGALSGQLAEFSQGEYGSQLITKRISEGSDMERDLV